MGGPVVKAARKVLETAHVNLFRPWVHEEDKEE